MSASVKSAPTGVLYLVGTPIGNLKDITLRALEVLKEADLVAAEDTRVAKKLLFHYGIDKPVISYHQYSLAIREDEILREVAAGKKVALTTDAGMPGISDPGEKILKAALARGLEIQVIPGPSALITALILSGISTERFVFEGFLPREGKQRRRLLEKLKEEPRTLIFYEAPHRILDTLKDISTLMGVRQVAVGRELTKRFEEVLRGTVDEVYSLLERKGEIKGEITLVLEGASIPSEKVKVPEEQWEAELKNMIDEGESPSRASKILADKYKISKKEIYSKAIEYKSEE